jgi:acyl-CoA synthetase (AMP-forming)/AMP-acid ligase II
MARGRRAAGVAKGARVGLLLPNSPEWVVSWLAVTRIGAVLVPVNTFFQRRELGWVLRHADVDTLLMAAAFRGHDYVEQLEEVALGLVGSRGAPLFAPALPFLRRVYVFGGCPRPWALDVADLFSGVDPRVDEDLLAAAEDCVEPADPMLILYSSGSTAEPKGALHSHGGVLRHVARLAARRDVKPDDRIWSPMPFFWVGGLVFALLGTFHAGACLLLEEVFEPARTLDLLERERATLALGWPHFGKALAEDPSFGERDLSSLRGGNIPGLLPAARVPADPELRATALGMTETCGPHTWGGEGALPESQRGTFGTPLEDVEHKVVDPESGRALAPGELGELCVRGPALMQALHKREREETFDADGFYRTGDAGFFDERGLLHFKGRLGELIKTGGANVTPGEVEQVLAVQPGVGAAYVVGIPDPERGQVVAAAVVPRKGRRPTQDGLRARLRKELSAYKVPRHILVCDGAELPFTDSGKIDRRRLAALLAERVRGPA